MKVKFDKCNRCDSKDIHLSVIVRCNNCLLISKEQKVWLND